jgi:exopolyphosphatase / guanosine-5'-triphosphate,3'-diphosphate pyrophosphatase
MRVAVIDIGSNTIKLLVAARSPTGGVDTVRYAVEEARIGRGLGGKRPALDADSMTRGATAVAKLLALARGNSPAKIALVATSAVRDAANGRVFAARILRETGHPVRILTGEEEADAIGRGLAADPALAGARDFYLFDLGGGSLECLEFRARHALQSVSIPLGCVRLTERCVADPSLPFTAADRANVAAAVRQAFAADAPGGFRFSLPSPAAAVATGGTVTTVRAMLAAQIGHALDDSSTTVTVAELEQLLARSAALPLASRRELPGLPAARADVFPTALATILEVARLAGVERFTHSFYNLRYGIADELLGG